jgi:restriction system protein
MTLEFWIHRRKTEKPTNKIREAEFIRRLIHYAVEKDKNPSVPPPWEGNTWVLDLLPERPRSAISALEAYLEAQILWLPDGRIHGLTDAMAVIRAKCIERPRSENDAIRLLLIEPPRTLEHLVERLYSAMGFKTRLTPRQNDGGYDVLAAKIDAGQRALFHIECKRWESNVGVPVLRGLLGVVSDTKATNGVCVTTSNLTATAKKFIDRNPRLDFLNGKQLVRMLNEHIGPNWYNEIDRLVLESRREALSGILSRAVGLPNEESKYPSLYTASRTAPRRAARAPNSTKKRRHF